MEVRITAPGIECKTRFATIADIVIIKLIEEISHRRPNDIITIEKEHEHDTEIKINDGIISACRGGKVKRYYVLDADRVSYDIIYKAEQSENI